VKAADENMVGNVSRKILAPLRNIKFFSVYEINQAIEVQLQKFIKRPFAKMERNRATAFERIDKPALGPLQRYEYCDWKEARIAYNYHVEYEKFYYNTHSSIPMQAVPCFVRATKDTIEVFVDHIRIAAHKRNYNKLKRYTTNPGWSTDRFISWANSIGPNTGQFVKKVLSASDYPVQSYCSCMAIMSHSRNNSNQVMEKASRKALELEIYSQKYFKMLVNKEGKKGQEAKPEKIVDHSNLRGKGAYVGGGINA